MRRLALLALLVAGCDRNDDCKRAVHHLFEITTMSPKGSEPSAEERRVIETVETMSLKKCRDEGLHADARDCILALRSLEDLDKLGACPGIVAHHPSWVIAGPPR